MKNPERTFIVTESEFSNLHNAKCYLHQAIDRLRSTLNPDLLSNISTSLKYLDNGLSGIYDQERLAWASDQELIEKTQKELGLKRSTWSAYVPNSFDDEHTYPDITKIVYAEHFGRGVVEVPIEGNTWADLWKAADRAMVLSGDNHHVFIENFEKRTINGEDVLTLVTGS